MQLAKDKMRVRGRVPVLLSELAVIRTGKCVSICPHSTVQRNAADRQCFILTVDLKRTCSVHCASISQRSELSIPSYLGIDGIENEMPGNEHFVE